MTQPDTQARALAKVESDVKEMLNGTSNPAQRKTILQWESALRTAIGIHEPVYGLNQGWYCKCYKQYGEETWKNVPFPCPELTEIAKEMGI